MVAQSSTESFATAPFAQLLELWELESKDFFLQRWMVSFLVVMQDEPTDRSLEQHFPEKFFSAVSAIEALSDKLKFPPSGRSVGTRQRLRG